MKKAATIVEGRPGATECPAYFAELYARSGGEKLGLSFQEFAGILQEVSGRYLGPNPAAKDAADLHESLRLEDLALARRCAQGSEPAWEYFVREYRPKLYAAAMAIAKDQTVARELADSLYADLFGTRQDGDGQRVSRLASYTGRGSLEGWLGAVLAQEYVNRYRERRRLVSFDERVEAGDQFAADGEAAADPVDTRIEQAVDAALLHLPAEERWLLASWYLDGRTLAEIALLFHVHESTISRRIEKITVSLRKQIVAGLRQRGMDARAAEEAMNADVRDLSLDVRGRLQEKDEETFHRERLKSWIGLSKADPGSQ
jgi:RNA polymerase sigma-70 factor (ECF subfamily)